MKKKILQLGMLTIMLALQSIKTNAQTTMATNNGGANTAWYLGWDNATTFDLNIKHNASSKNINFWTTNAGGTTAQRMTILGGTSAGKVGIGIAAPTNLVHQHVSTASTVNYHQWTNSNASNGLLIGLDAADNAVFNMQENTGFLWLTNVGTPRMKISASGRLLIGDYSSAIVSARKPSSCVLTDDEIGQSKYFIKT